MAKNSLNRGSASPDLKFTRREVLPKNHYFDNELVERQLYEYLEGACTSVELRNKIMESAEELIRQVIIAHNLGRIYPGREESSIGDLSQTAWLQIESMLYKYEARPHCSDCYNPMRPMDSVLSDDFIFADEVIIKIKKCPYCKQQLTRDKIYYKGKSRVFNLWSQVSRTVILAYIKKENRDRKNGPVFQKHVENRDVPRGDLINRFLHESRELCKYNPSHLKLLECIEQLYNEDDRPYDSLITKLAEKSQIPRYEVVEFIHTLRLRSHDISDSPVNEEVKDKLTGDTIDEPEE